MSNIIAFDDIFGDLVLVVIGSGIPFDLDTVSIELFCPDSAHSGSRSVFDFKFNGIAPFTLIFCIVNSTHLNGMFANTEIGDTDLVLRSRVIFVLITVNNNLISCNSAGIIRRDRPGECTQIVVCNLIRLNAGNFFRSNHIFEIQINLADITCPSGSIICSDGNDCSCICDIIECTCKNISIDFLSNIIAFDDIFGDLVLVVIGSCKPADLDTVSIELFCPDSTHFRFCDIIYRYWSRWTPCSLDLFIILLDRT